MEQKIAVYTCIAGGYEQKLPTVENIDRGFKYICFSDKCMPHIGPWEISKLKSPTEIKRADLINRFHKFFCENLIEGADVSVYIDGNIDIKTSLTPLVQKFNESGALLACLMHPQRSNIFEEADACIKLRKFKADDILRLDQQLKTYSKNGFPIELPLCAAGVLFRKHRFDSRLSEAMSMWWEQVNTYTCRDQLSLPYVLWQTRLPYTIFDIDVLNNRNGYFFRRAHASKQNKLERLGLRLKQIVLNVTT